MNWASSAVQDSAASTARRPTMRGSEAYFFVPSTAVRPSFCAVCGSTTRGSLGFCSPRCSFGKFSGLLGTLKFLSLRRVLSVHGTSRRACRVSRHLQRARPGVSRASDPQLAYSFSTRLGWKGAKQQRRGLPASQFTVLPARTYKSRSKGEWT
jgi:hypothetical protein